MKMRISALVGEEVPLGVKLSSLIWDDYGHVQFQSIISLYLRVSIVLW